MKPVSKFLAGAAVAAALSVGAAAPAAAQYYPNPYGGGGLGDIITGAILNSILRGGNPYGYNQYYGRNDYNLERAAVDQCARAAEQRINQRYGGYYQGGYNQPYGGYGGYNQPGYGYNQGAYRIAQIDRVERTRNGNMRVYGLATNGAYQGNYGQPYYGGYNQPGYGQPGYGYGYNQASANVRFNCKYDRRGRITDLKVNRA